jgi:uncharacterized protein YdiU (UPF0061 family)
MTSPIPFDNSYARLPDRFFARTRPAEAPAPRLIELNRPLALALGLDPDWLAGPEGVAMLSGREVVPGSEPIAMAYAGHQFGSFVPSLGDGRAILLGEVVGRDGQRYDLQLKGSGRTLFSRGGDGRAALGPVLREHLVSEAMAAMGIPTTRTLASVITGDEVYRETVLPGAVLTRVARSHVRVGTFQYFAARQDHDAVRLLTDHVVARLYPEAAEAERPALAFLDRLVGRQAELVASWLLVGFIHGVMNTDNMSVAGETIDYGPCAFMDAFHPQTVFSSIDQNGRYAYANQPGIAQWNLTRLAECLLPLLGPDEDQAVERAKEVLTGFGARFEAAFHAGLRRKLGLLQAEPEDVALAQELLGRMAANNADFTLTFRRLADAAADAGADATVRALFSDPAAYDGWAASWRERLARDGGEPQARRLAMRQVNPLYIPRNHQVEAAIRAGVDADDFGPFRTLLAVLAGPYADQPEHAHLAEPPRPEERVLQTFCGT